MWWLQPGWTEAICPRCGKKIWPEGDPDWGLCVECFDDELYYKKLAREQEEQELEELENARIAEESQSKD